MIDEQQQRSLAARARKGIVALLTRQASTQVVTLLCGIALARLLSPADFGIYAIATFFVDTVNRLGNFGISSALVQRKERLTASALHTAFLLQQGGLLLGGLALNALSPWLSGLYPEASSAFPALIAAVSVTLLLSAWRSMGELQLSRELKFKAVANIELVETMVFQFVALGMACAGLAIWSLVVALLARSLVGSLLMFRAAPWVPRLAWNWPEAKAVLAYGLPFQGSNLLNSVGAWITPLLVGPTIGATAVGYLNFSSSNGRKPLIVVSAVMRVSFAHFSRLQDQPALVEQTIARTLNWLLLGTVYWFVALLLAGADVVHLVYSEKWVPVIPTLVLFAAAVSVDCFSWVVAQAQAALGHATAGFRRTAIRTALIVAISVPLVLKIGIVGVPAGYIIAYLATLHLSFVGLPKGAMRRMLAAQAWLLIPMLVACAAGFAAYELTGATRLLRALSTLAALTLAYLGSAWLCAPQGMRSAVTGKLRQALNRLAAPPPVANQDP